MSYAQKFGLCTHIDMSMHADSTNLHENAYYE